MTADSTGSGAPEPTGAGPRKAESTGTRSALQAAVREIERHAGSAGWDRRPRLFALVPSVDLLAAEPDLAGRLGLDPAPASDALTPVEQDDLPDQPLDELLAGIAWPDSVDGCAVAQEIVILPPSAEAEWGDTPESVDAVARAAAHPERREARLVVGVLRDGSDAGVMRVRGTDGMDDELLTGPDLAPNLVVALRETLQ